MAGDPNVYALAALFACIFAFGWMVGEFRERLRWFDAYLYDRTIRVAKIPLRVVSEREVPRA